MVKVSTEMSLIIWGFGAVKPFVCFRFWFVNLNRTCSASRTCHCYHGICDLGTRVLSALPSTRSLRLKPDPYVDNSLRAGAAEHQSALQQVSARRIRFTAFQICALQSANILYRPQSQSITPRFLVAPNASLFAAGIEQQSGLPGSISSVSVDLLLLLRPTCASRGSSGKGNSDPCPLGRG